MHGPPGAPGPRGRRRRRSPGRTREAHGKPTPSPGPPGKQGHDLRFTLTGSRDPAAAEPGRARQGRAGPEGSDPGAAAAEAAGRRRSRPALLPPAEPSPPLRKCSALLRHFRSGVDPRSQGSRRTRGNSAPLLAFCCSPSVPVSDQGTASAEGCDRQQRRGLGFLERSHGIASGFRLPAPPARIFLTRVSLMDSSLHCL